MDLLAAEITAVHGKDPRVLRAWSASTAAPGTRASTQRPRSLSATRSRGSRRHSERHRAGRRPDCRKAHRAPGNDAPIGGSGHDRAGLVRRATVGTEDIYKVYAESFRSEEHLHRIQQEGRRSSRGLGAAARRDRSGMLAGASLASVG